ncbi:MAG: peptidase M14 [Planctomycetaceae bacterium]|nr:peptidase M14 [Planctomycetaceae bacterium]
MARFPRRFVSLLLAVLCCAPALAQGVPRPDGALARLLAAPAADGAKTVPSPEEHLGRSPTADFQLVDWDEASGYWRRLAATSPHVRLAEVGETSEGRTFLLGAISSAANLARLDELAADARRIADPAGLTAEERAALLARAKPFVFVSLAMHATECAGTGFGLEFAHQLATSDEEPYRSARDRLVVFVPPSLNPDGVDHVATWYRRTVHTPDEGADLTELYQRYAGHDNNRDWFSRALPETRIVTDLLYRELFPQVLWDVHQQGQYADRFFVPPYRDPLNPNLDPALVTAIGAFGSRALHDLTAAGLSGVSTGVSYDMWWNGGNRSTPVRHNVIAFLTEAASANLGSPLFVPRTRLQAPRGLDGYAPSNRFPDPWPGGWWRIGDISRYQHHFARSLLASLVREPELALRATLSAAERAIDRGASDPPVAFLVRADGAPPRALRRLVELLHLGGVRIERAAADFEADGVPHPAGTLVVPLAQPYGRFVKDLLERQQYPEGSPPYDVSGWSLGLLFGLDCVAVQRPFAAQLLPLASADQLPGAAGSAAAWAALPGDAPRVGVVSPWEGVRGEGWLRWFLDSYGVAHTRLRPEALRAGRLRERFDTILIASTSPRGLESGRTDGPREFEGGIGTEGALHLREFVAAGGQLFALGASSAYAVDLFDLAVDDAARGSAAGDFSCPGSVLRTELGPAAAELRLVRAPAVLFSGGHAFAQRAPAAGEVEAESVLHYARERLLLSGWIRGEAAIAGRSAWLRAKFGDGEVHVLGFEPQYRGWSEASMAALVAVLCEQP